MLREQKFNSKSHNFFSEAVEFISALEPDLRASIEQGRRDIVNLIERG